MLGALAAPRGADFVAAGDVGVLVLVGSASTSASTSLSSGRATCSAASPSRHRTRANLAAQGAKATPWVGRWGQGRPGAEPRAGPWGAVAGGSDELRAAGSGVINILVKHYQVYVVPARAGSRIGPTAARNVVKQIIKDVPLQ